MCGSSRRHDDHALYWHSWMVRRYLRSAVSSRDTDDGPDIYHSILPLLDGALKNPRPVRLVGVSTSNLAQDAIQHGLFDDPRKRRLTEAVDALNEKMGKRAIRPASLLNTSHNDHITFRG